MSHEHQFALFCNERLAERPSCPENWPLPNENFPAEATDCGDELFDPPQRSAHKNTVPGSQPLPTQKPAGKVQHLTTDANGIVQLTIPGLTDLRSSPDAFWKSALFGAVAKNNRKVLQPGEDLMLLDAYGYKILLTGGPRSRIPGPYGTSDEVVSAVFSQADHTVFLGLLTLVEGRLGAKVDLEPFRFVKSIGLRDDTRTVRSLFRSLARMRETRIAVRYIEKGTGHNVDLVANLIGDVAYNHDTSRYSVSLSPQLARLFAPANFSTIVWGHRLALGSDMGRFFHGVFASNTEAFVYWLKDLQAAYSFKGTPRRFKSDLKKVLPEIEAVTGWRIKVNDKADSLKVDKTRKAKTLVPIKP